MRLRAFSRCWRIVMFAPGPSCRRTAATMAACSACTTCWRWALLVSDILRIRFMLTSVCSTFDSAPQVGNIGRALEIGTRVFAQHSVPVVVGVPQLRRYTVFGQHFAAMNGITYRLDRHPVMSRHPVTPMHEADLRLHLAGQTQMPVDLIDWLSLNGPDADAATDRAMRAGQGDGPRAVLFDVPDLTTQQHVGHQLWRQTRAGQSLFTVGSSGVEYAVVPEWAARGLIQGEATTVTSVGAVSQIAVVSGSCSEITAAQIRTAGEQGFALVAVDAARLSSRSQGDTEQLRVLVLAREALDQGRSVIVHSAMGPDDMATPSADLEPHAIGRRLGRLLRNMVAHSKLKRVVVAGGDTSSHALRELHVHALTVAMALPLTPGSPLCTAHSDDAAFDGLQVALKGGQIGTPDYFVAIRNGRL
jgi:uncharacterized protein YgbK (DUF1537 family)